MNIAFDIITSLQYKVKNLTDRVRSFESGEKYTEMDERFKTLLRSSDSTNRRLTSELARAERRIVAMRHEWEQVYEDLEEEHKKDLAKKDREIARLKERVSRMENQRDEYRTKLNDRLKELYQVKTALEDEKGKTLKLKAQINRDYENSSLPSSQKPNHKKIANNREKTEKKPGGQPGHIGHMRKQHKPTNRIEIPAPDKYMNISNFKPTGRIIKKQLIGISVNVTVNEYFTPEFRNVRTGQRVHANFPDGVVNEVNYDGCLKAFAFLLNNYCNVSVEKVSDFISELTDGQLTISTGMINGLSKGFSFKTESEQKKAFADMQLAPTIYTDFTSARLNGRNVNVIVCATPSSALYFAREHKGHEGIKGAPVEEFQNTLVHDHDKTFYNYGGAHQECLDHVSRYLKDSMDNEPKLCWNLQMRELIREMIHFRNTLGPNEKCDPDQIDPDKVRGFEAKFDGILKLAKQEYEYEPPSKYFIEGFNLYKRLVEYRDNHLLFLHDINVAPTNNLSERLLRVFKRKLKQMMTFRSFGSLDYLCRSLGMIATLRSQGGNLYRNISSVFDA
jgi:hypothetical protein